MRSITEIKGGSNASYLPSGDIARGEITAFCAIGSNHRDFSLLLIRCHLASPMEDLACIFQAIMRIIARYVEYVGVRLFPNP